MIYFDDIAVWTKTQKGSIVRGILCGICVVATGLVIWKTCSDIDKLDATIQANEVTLAEKAYELSAIEKKIEEYDVQSIVDTYMASYCGDAVSGKQIDYFSILGDMNIDNMNKRLLENEDALSVYFSGRGGAVGPWFEMNTSNIKLWLNWQFLTRQASTVTDIPSIWILTAKERSGENQSTIDINDIICVVVGNYNAKTETFSDVEVYDTYTGNVFKNTYVMTNVGSVINEKCLVNSENNAEHYAAWRSILDGKEYEPVELNIDETVSENTTTETTDTSTEPTDKSESDEKPTSSALDALNSALNGGDN